MIPVRSTPELLTLQALRLAGFAEERAIADRALLPAGQLGDLLDGAVRSGYVEPLRFAEAHGWILTETGHARLAALLERDVDDADARDVLATTIAEFERPEGINARFVETVSKWQLRSTAAVQPALGAAEDLEALLSELAVLGERLRTVLAALSDRLPRFGRYPAHYDLAMRRARSEGLGWVTGVGILSCHAVWAELHQDLRSSVGEDRTPEVGDRR